MGPLSFCDIGASIFKIKKLWSCHLGVTIKGGIPDSFTLCSLDPLHVF
jgi:hypothetical protein